MSDEESFVILGTSPMPSMDKGEESFASDSPGSCFASLKSSQLQALNNAAEGSLPTSVNDISMTAEKAEKAENMNKSSSQIQAEMADVKRMGNTAKAASAPISLENKPNSRYATPINSLTNSVRSTPAVAKNSLAASFILGEINADVLKNSVYSQFPSVSMEACAEDVVKLQTLMSEYVELKATLAKVNDTMRQFYHKSQQWKEEMHRMEHQYKEQLKECQTQIEKLRQENEDLKSDINTKMEQIKAVEEVRQKEHTELIQMVSEKTALVDNMRAQISKLEKQQLDSYEFVDRKDDPQNKQDFNIEDYITRSEHESKLKDLQRQLSEMLASNLDLKDVQKQYVDEITCLKVNLTSAEELIKQFRAEINELKALDLDKQAKITELEQQNKALEARDAEQSERITLLETQNEVHRKDFEMERDARQNAVGEKHQALQDLRALQQKNQLLIEEHQKLVESLEQRAAARNSAPPAPLPYTDSSAQRYFRAATPPSPSFQAVPPPSAHYCPICNKPFKSLSTLQSHVNECLDKV